MECKFIRHGISLSYDNIVKPCCTWTLDADWKKNNHLNNTDLAAWHSTSTVIDMQENLSQNKWPTGQEYLLEGTIPVELRGEIIDSLHRAIHLVEDADIESGQKSNAVNALTKIATELQVQAWNQTSHQQWCNFVGKMDRVKGLAAGDYCSILDKILQYKIS